MQLKTGFYCRSTCFHNVALFFIYCSKYSLLRAVLQIMWWVIKMHVIYLSWWWSLPATPEHQMYQTTFHNNPGNNTAIIVNILLGISLASKVYKLMFRNSVSVPSSWASRNNTRLWVGGWEIYRNGDKGASQWGGRTDWWRKSDSGWE